MRTAGTTMRSLSAKKENAFHPQDIQPEFLDSGRHSVVELVSVHRLALHKQEADDMVVVLVIVLLVEGIRLNLQNPVTAESSTSVTRSILLRMIVSANTSCSCA
jgi:hypothetical protein